MSLGGTDRVEDHGRDCDWCGHGIPVSTRVRLGNRCFCCKGCVDAYLSSGGEGKVRNMARLSVVSST